MFAGLKKVFVTGLNLPVALAFSGIGPDATINNSSVVNAPTNTSVEGRLITTLPLNRTLPALPYISLCAHFPALLLCRWGWCSRLHGGTLPCLVRETPSRERNK